MAMMIYAGDRDVTQWIEALRAVDDSMDIRIYPDVGDVRDIIFGLSWQYPEGLWSEYPNLRALSSIGAGVSHILDDETLDRDISILKLTDNRLNQSMWEYLLATISYQAMQLHLYRYQQSDSHWHERVPRGFDSVTVGIFGLGSIGRYVAEHLVELGFRVKGFATTAKSIDGVDVYSGDMVTDSVLQSLDIVVSILPLTASTIGFFDREFFDRLSRGATIINVGRGAQIVESDLIRALDSGQLSHVWLDVFEQEPLDKQHPFWSYPKISITPHIASITDPVSVAPQIVENYHALVDGQPMRNVVDRSRGY